MNRQIRVTQTVGGWFVSFLYWASLAALLALLLAFLLVIRGEIPHAVGITNETLRVHQDSCACPTVEVSNFPGEIGVNNFPPGFQVLGPVEVSNFPTELNVTVLNSLEVNNFPSGFNVLSFPGEFNVSLLSPLPLPVDLVTGNINLTGNVIFPSMFEATIAGGEVNCTILNPVTSVSVDNFPSSNIMQAVTPMGSIANISSTSTGLLNVNIREPTSAFGSIMTENLWPIFQTEAVYGVNPAKTTAHTLGTGSVSASNSAFVVETGTTIGSYATLQSRKRLFYRPGQGSRVMFSALFPETNSTLINRAVGLGSPEDGVFFGFFSGAFGIYYNNRGKREIRTLTITTASSTAESVTVTLNGVAFAPPVTASGNIQRTVWELAQFLYAGWRAEAVGATVIFIGDQAESRPGSYSITGTTVMGSFAQTRMGAATNINFISQASWNGDRLDGSGTSGVILDTSKFNIYGISMGYLGASSIRFFMQVIPPGTSDSYFATVHTLELPNTLVQTTFGNPSFPFSAAARTFTASESGIINVGSFSGFVEGHIKYTGNRFTFQRTLMTTIDASVYYPFFTIRNAHVRNGIANQGVVNIVGVSGSVKHNQPATIYVFISRDSTTHTLGGNPNFAPYSSNSGILYDTAATSFTPSTNAQLIWTRELAESGSGERYFLPAQDFESITLEPGEFLSVCGRTNMGTANSVSASLEVREDE